MKTITVTDETYDFLMTLAQEVNTQDNKSTAKPYEFHDLINKEMHMLFKFLEEISDEKQSTESWRDDIATYLSLVIQAKEELLSDRKFMDSWMKFNPKCNYELTVQKSHDMFWGTESGWEFCKRKRKTKKLNMLSALKNSLDKNRVYNFQVDVLDNRFNKPFNKDKYVADRIAAIEESNKKDSSTKQWQ